MEKFIMADGCAVRVRDSQQQGLTVVLLHGYLESIEIWDDFIPLLKGVRVVAMDIPGHGISEVKGQIHTMEFLARTLKGVLDRLGVDKAIVVGHSMGGYVAMEFLKLFPERTCGIVLFHSTPDADTDAKREQRQREIELILAGKKELLARTNPESRFAPRNRKRLATLVEELSEEIFLIEDEGIIALLRGMAARSDYNSVLKQSAIPQLFIFGRDDQYIPVDVADKIIAANGQAHVVWLEESGHIGFIEEPKASAKAILEFVEECMR